MLKNWAAASKSNMDRWRERVFSIGWISLVSMVAGYIILIAVLPVGTVFLNSIGRGWDAFLADVTMPAALYALRLTLLLSLAVAVVNGILGLITAYVLVRYDFPGKSFINAMIDLPFAIPTTVSGLMLLTIYGEQGPVGKIFSSLGIPIAYALPGIFLALLLITFPFGIRSVQPVLEEMDKEMEDAAYNLGATPWQTFRKITFPSLLPGALAGFTLSFARAMAEFGAVVIISGNIPMKTQLASVYIFGEMESHNLQGANSISAVLLIFAIGLILLQNILARRGRIPLVSGYLAVKLPFRKGGEPL